MSNADAAYQQGYTRGQSAQRELFQSTIKERIFSLYKKIAKEEFESRMWQYFVGAKDGLVELLDEIEVKEELK